MVKNSRVSRIMNAYLTYIKNKYPINFLTDIFRNYTRFLLTLKHNISLVPSIELPEVTTKIPCEVESQNEDTKSSKYKELSVDSRTSKESIEITNIFDKKSGRVCIFKKPSEDFNLREKVNKKPADVTKKQVKTSKVGIKREYPWQNFNIDSHKPSKYNRIKSVNSLASEFLTKKSNLKKTNSTKKYFTKEVKFNEAVPLILHYKKSSSYPRDGDFSTKNKLVEDETATLESINHFTEPVLFEPTQSITKQSTSALSIPSSSLLVKPRFSEELEEKSSLEYIEYSECETSPVVRYI